MRTQTTTVEEAWEEAECHQMMQTLPPLGMVVAVETEPTHQEQLNEVVSSVYVALHPIGSSGLG
ncbi:hypothetical protein E2C01_022584 [Portunus trituberculatus]|uniref:Uncharacterized protein n=1 Tax=Portunus trituberculatus TaxID=210409 RepID=A0A5B7E808_PORTR|nr:hypothetical protein [Portunus trituberculatus]